MIKRLTISTFGSAAAGAAVMFFLDPAAGRQRRRRFRDRLGNAQSRFEDFVDAGVRDLENRAKGVVAGARYQIAGGRHVTGDVLGGRVHAKLGRIVSHPRAIDVHVDAGTVTLSGPILAAEVEPATSEVARIPGVKEVVNRLEPHQDAGRIPDLQGGKVRGQRHPLIVLTAPGPRLIGVGLGGAMALAGLFRRGIRGRLQTLAGLSLALPSAAPVLLRRRVALQKTMVVHASLEQVFEFFSDVVNFPRFMRNVRDVRDLGNGRSHWIIAGPAGMPVEWDAVTTTIDRPKMICWKSDGDGHVRHEGKLAFTKEGERQTRIDVRLSYEPPVGAVGHAALAFLGVDPKSEMDQDFIRAKAFLETGRPARDAAQHIH